LCCIFPGTVVQSMRHKNRRWERSAKRVVVKYPSEGGYAPGDNWNSTSARPELKFVYHGVGQAHKKAQAFDGDLGRLLKAGPLHLTRSSWHSGR
jgi:hypothetical protein